MIPQSRPAGFELTDPGGLAIIGIGLSACLLAASLLGLVGTAFAIVIVLATALLLVYSRGSEGIGAANLITFGRASITAIIAGLTVETLAGQGPVGERMAWLMAGLATFELLLDGIDGPVARRTGAAGTFGARFDMEVDAFLVLVLSVLTAAMGKVGPWIVLAGLLRYFFVAASFFFPRLGAPLPPSFRRRVVCVIQIAVLIAMLTPLLQPPLSGMVGSAALLGLIYSFGVDIVWTIRRRPPS